MVTSLWEERADLCAYRAFVYFARVDVCPFSPPLCVRCWLRLVIVTLPGLLTFFQDVFIPDNDM